MIPANNHSNNGSPKAGTSSGPGTASGTVGRSINATETNSNGIAITKNSSIEAEFNRIPDISGWHRFYQDIREKCDREANEKNFLTSESEKPQNRCLNRYRDVNPYDHSRIILHRGSVDYINANLVKLERADRKYILTQGPLCETVGHFWLMVWEQNSKAILMLNKLMEKKQVKCHKYWPDKMGPEHVLKLDEVKLTVEFLRCEEYKNFCRRWFKLTDLESGQCREIIQFHYTTWPDFGIPSSPVAFLQFLKQVRDSGALDHDVGPAVVHCSAGIGRSGTFCLVDCCLVLIDKEGEGQVSVKEVLYELRRYRMGLIQTADQLYFSYQAIIEGIKLLKDPNFLEYNETPYISNNDEQNHESFNMDETPPPLPPRSHSLPVADTVGSLLLSFNQRINPGKPLPKIPNSESFNDELYTTDNNHPENVKHNKDALNNFINNEKINADSISNRPLPPLPLHSRQQPRTVIVLNDSDSEENEFYEDDDDDDNENNDGNANANNADKNDNNADGGAAGIVTVKNDSGKDINAIETDMEVIDKHVNDVNDTLNGNNDVEKKLAQDNKFTIGAGIQPKKNVTNANDEAIEQRRIEQAKKSNGIDAITSGTSTGHLSAENELKRRKRAERQASIEQKVNEIKRKQREAEESKKKAKKQRSFVTYVAAGVIVGVICVYAYTKFASD